MTDKIGHNVAYAARLLQSGKVVAVPTETVYGLAANALDTAAVARIFSIKNRPFFDPLIVHLHDVSQVTTYAQDIPEIAYRLAEAFWPGPLTLVLPRQAIIPDLVTSGLTTVGLRMPAHPLTRQLLQQLPFPLAAPSANPFGYISPTTAQHVYDQLGEQVDYILDGGACSVGVESTIVGFEEDSVVLYRLGGIAVEELEKVAGPVRLVLHESSNPAAPGQLEAHYAPRKPLWLGDVRRLAREAAGRKLGILTLSDRYSDVPAMHHLQLSPTEDLQEAATHLFEYLRYLDQADIDIIIAEPLPEKGLGRAINDRLRRASVRY